MNDIKNFIYEDVTIEDVIDRWAKTLLHRMERYISEREKSRYTGQAYLEKHHEEMRTIESLILSLTTMEIKSFFDFVEKIYGESSEEFATLERFYELRNLDEPKLKEPILWKIYI